MRLIKEATGVSDIQEIIAKFQSQGDTRAHLAHLQQQSEKRIEELKEKKAKVLAELDELKFSSESKRSHSSRLMQEFREHLVETQVQTNEAKLKCDRGVKLLENSKQGIKHLCSKLENIHLVSPVI
jgi:DNA repair exonuclease SbcCD ATPase subunit